MNRLSDHLSNDDLARYGEQKMPPAELLKADAHLAACEECYARLNDQAGAGAKLRSASQAFTFTTDVEPAHLSYEQLAALVDQQLDDIEREIAESHLELCTQCEAELHDLRQLVRQIDTSSSPTVPASRPSSWGARFATLWPLPALRWSVLATALLASLALFAFLLSLPIRNENARLRDKIAELERSNETLEKRIAAVESLESEVAALREENDRLRQLAPATGPAPVELNDDGRRITLDIQGNLAGLQAAPNVERLVKEALRSGRVKTDTAWVGAGGKPGVLMGDPASPEFRLLSPINLVLKTDRPSFHWKGLEGVATFQVTIFDEALNKVAESQSLTTTEWTVTRPLARGQTFVWQVRASANQREIVAPAAGSSRARFKVLEQAKDEEIARARKTFANSHLLMGILYADAGLLDDAEREFRALRNANPQSPVARSLLQSIA